MSLTLDFGHFVDSEPKILILIQALCVITPPVPPQLYIRVNWYNNPHKHYEIPYYVMTFSWGFVSIFCFDKHLCKSLQKSVVFIRDLFLTFLISYLFIFIDKRDCILETSEIVIRDMYNELHRGVTYAKVRIAIPGTAKWAQISGHFCLFVVYFTHISPLYSDRHHYLFLRFLLFTPLT